jgi:Uma2 family endonuclease
LGSNSLFTPIGEFTYVPPTWVCEVVSTPNTANIENDPERKIEILPRYNVQHYWLFWAMTDKVNGDMHPGN